LLIILLLCQSGILSEPVLYLSLYLKQNQGRYYDLLQRVRTDGAWEAWLEFFLDGIYKSAKQALATAEKINKLFSNDLSTINTLGRARFSCLETFEHLQKLPQISAPVLTSCQLADLSWLARLR
jgi:Fic family protein